MNPSIVIACVVVGLVVAVVVGALAFYAGSVYRRKTAEAKIGSAEEEAKRLVNEAIRTAEQKRKEGGEANDRSHRGGIRVRPA